MKKFYCKGKKDFCEDYDRCLTNCRYFDGSGGGYRKVPMTNANRIRAMSDEELGVWICKHALSCGCCVGVELCRRDDGIANGAVKWLQMQAEEADHENL